MALLNSELARIKYELGVDLLTVGASPYLGGHLFLFEQIIQPYLTGGAVTTCSTSVSAADSPAFVTLTLSSATGFSLGDAVIVDVDSLQERATIRSISGAAIGVLLSKAHTGTYPVLVEGGESIIRGILQKLQALDGMSGGPAAGSIDAAIGNAGIKRVEDIEFYGGASAGEFGGKSELDQLKKMRDYWRGELASALGLSDKGGCSSLVAY